MLSALKGDKGDKRASGNLSVSVILVGKRISTSLPLLATKQQFITD